METGNRLSVTEHDGRHVGYEYDGLSRLLSETIADPVAGNRTIRYLMDPVGNRLTRIDTIEGQTDYTYDANDQLLTEALGSVVTRYTYDASGNTLSRSNPTEESVYHWSAENRLVAANITSAGAPRQLVYRYDDDGIRVSSTLTEGGNTTATAYLVDANRPFAQVLEEWTSINAQPATFNAAYTYGHHQPISQQRDGVRTYYHADHLGTTRALTDQTGISTDSYTFDAYGRPLRQTGSTENRYLFAGEQRDKQLGLDYLRARYVNVGAGRFYGRDTHTGQLLRPSTRHKFVYAGGNPVGNSDPSGQVTLAETMTVTAIRGIITKNYVKRLGVGMRNTLIIARFKLKPGADLQDKGLQLLSLGDTRGFELYVKGRELTAAGFGELSANLNEVIVKIGEDLMALKDLFEEDEGKDCFGPTEFLQKRAAFFGELGDWLEAFAFLEDINDNLDRRTQLDHLAAQSRKFGLILNAISDSDFVKFIEDCEQ